MFNERRRCLLPLDFGQRWPLPRLACLRTRSFFVQLAQPLENLVSNPACPFMWFLSAQLLYSHESKAYGNLNTVALLQCLIVR
jgi:hypothetical protein